MFYSAGVMNTHTQPKSTRVKRTDTPIYVQFSELLVLFDDQRVLTADNKHYLIDGDTLRPIRVAWGRDY